LSNEGFGEEILRAVFDTPVYCASKTHIKILKILKDF
jgi:hypothetical protein